MTGTSRITGQTVGFDAHLDQSISDILTTPIGTRVMLRDYGSNLPDLIDAPMNADTVIDVFMATAEALDTWEPRIQLTRVQIEAVAPGHMELALDIDVDGGSGSLSIEVAA